MRIPFLEGAEASDPIQWIFIHSMDHSMHWGPLGISKLTLNMWFAFTVLALMLAVTRKEGAVPSGILRGIFEMIYFFIRDEIVYPVMGAHHGRTFMPFFLTMFTAIFMMNLVGMVPLPFIGGAATSTFGLTIPLAVITLVVSIGAGIIYQGPVGFMKVFIPPGVPSYVLVILFPIEVIGFFIKHGVLAIRLFANMLAGHLVLGGFLGLIFLFGTYFVSLIAIPLALFISLVEVLVAFLQAYVFTLLSVLFIGGTVHPDH